jgi:integrase/recombinase XerD
MKTDFETLAQEFETSRKVRNLKAKTLSETGRHLTAFFEYLCRRNISHVDGITKEVISTYQIKQYERINHKGVPNSIGYQNAVLRAVKQFVGFLKDTGYIVSGPVENVPYAKEPKTLPRSIMTPSETRKILNMPDTKSVIGYRDRTMLEVLYSTGIRKTELQKLTINDVDYHDGFMRVNGKGDKERVVPIGRIACRYLENYIKTVRPELIKDPYNSHLFLSIRGNRINTNMTWYIIKKYAKKAKIKKNVHCHTFRHTCATAMLKNRADIRTIQELLGHESLLSTQIYTHVSINDLKEVHKRCHPREKDKE